MNKYLEYTKHDPGKSLSIKEQLRLIAQDMDGGRGGYLLWRRQGGAGGSWPLAFFDNQEDAEEALEAVRGITEGRDTMGRYTIEEV